MSRQEPAIDGRPDPKPWRREAGVQRYLPDPDAWLHLRSRLRLGQILTGTVEWVPRPGVAGIGIDLGLPVGGWVDVLHLPHNAARWPAIGTVTTFTIWWLDDRPQIRLMPTDPAFRREDFTTWIVTESL